MKAKEQKSLGISDAEWVVMKELWRKSPQLASDIAERLSSATEWNPKTVKTLLARLVKKGALRFEKQDRSYLYHAAIDEKTCVREETRSFMDRFYGGALKPMLASFIEEGRLSKRELEELRDLLDKRKEK